MQFYQCQFYCHILNKGRTTWCVNTVQSVSLKLSFFIILCYWWNQTLCLNRKWGHGFVDRWLDALQYLWSCGTLIQKTISEYSEEEKARLSRISRTVLLRLWRVTCDPLHACFHGNKPSSVPQKIPVLFNMFCNIELYERSSWQLYVRQSLWERHWVINRTFFCILITYC